MGKKILILFLFLFVIISIAGCSEETSNDKDIFESGEEAIITNNNGNEMYSIKIEEAKVADDFEYKEDFSENTTQIVEVEYTYKNIAQEDALLYIHGQDLQVVDQQNKVAESSDMFPKQQPQDSGVGTEVTVQAYYGLENESEEIQVILRSEMYDSEIEYRIPVTK
ncbi:hypothetical protein [Senegalia massiliensis]|uniref:DUF4352 domain-containing protein n=1 Tax=Senegalia massiliensis TaxID=1720316 RepID=A0A845QTA7_9CLOT|nr:hypothetical protein [Senegalia massiliensis]NBI05775.1 hypothetical protein [Senegalia massiliensis]